MTDIPITPSMLEAGRKAQELRRFVPDEDMVRIYRAMEEARLRAKDATETGVESNG
jgi:hypothetical protein